MKAMLLTAPRKLEMVDFPAPAVAPDEVLVAIKACGICGSDIHGWDGSSGRRNPPLIMGHEASGRIVRVGGNVRGWQPEDRVTFDSTIYCGQCAFCAAGEVNLCENRRVFGVAPAQYRQHGAFAEYLAVPARLLYRLPDEVSFPHAAMLEPVAVALHAVQRVRVDASTTTVVVGAGMIGLFVIQALRWKGTREIIAIDLDESRLAKARELGATRTLLSRNGSVVEEVQRITGGRGADVAFEVVGFEPTLDLAIAAVRKGGACVLVGNLAPRTGFALQQVVTRELSLLGSCASAGEFPQGLELIARGVIKIDPLISGIAPLADGPAWFERLSAKGGSQYLKVILQP